MPLLCKSQNLRKDRELVVAKYGTGSLLFFIDSFKLMYNSDTYSTGYKNNNYNDINVSPIYICVNNGVSGLNILF